MKRLMESFFESPPKIAAAPPALVAAADADVTAFLDARDAAARTAGAESYEGLRAVWADDRQPMSVRRASETAMRSCRKIELERAADDAKDALRKWIRENLSDQHDGGQDRGSGFGMNAED